MKRPTRTILALLFGAAIACAEEAAKTESLEDTVNYLLDFVAKSDCAFIRNDTTHTGKEAADHIRRKYEHFRKQVKTPEDFIRLAASKSLLSGKPYLVRTKDGKEVGCEKWLSGVLEDYRKTRKDRKQEG